MDRFLDRPLVGHIHHVPPVVAMGLGSFQCLGREALEPAIIDVLDVGEESFLRTLGDLCPQGVPTGVIAE